MKQISLLILVIVLPFLGRSQKDTTQAYSNEFFEGFDDSYRGNASIRAVFYNLENLFDTYDDTLKNDESFLPDGDHHWSNYKYYKKSRNRMF